MSNLRWDDVRIFLAIHRGGTLAGAARLLKVDQTTIGRRLAALEGSLDARLFDRTPDGLSLTPAGEGILDAAERAEESMLALERRVSGEDARIEGVVRLATSDAFGIEYLVPRLSRLRARHPGILLEVVTAQSFVALSRREADLAVRLRPKGSPPAQENVVCRKLAEMGFALHAKPGLLNGRKKIEAPEDTRGLDLIVLDEGAPALPGIAFLREAAKHANVVLEATSLLVMLAAARAGMGIAMLPCFMAANVPALEQVSPVLDRSEGWLLVHPDLQHAARIRAVMEAVVEVTREDGRMLRGEP